MVALVEEVQGKLGRALQNAAAQTERLAKHGNVARVKVAQLHETTKTLLPQIRYWLRTGRVASGKILNLHMPRLYAIVRGKTGKAVEFGVKWGITRLRSGFLMATMANRRRMLMGSPPPTR